MSETVNCKFDVLEKPRPVEVQCILHHAGNSVSVEASSLGWEPGFLPNEMTVTVGDYKPETYRLNHVMDTHGEVFGFYFVSIRTLRAITVWND